MIPSRLSDRINEARVSILPILKLRPYHPGDAIKMHLRSIAFIELYKNTRALCIAAWKQAPRITSIAFCRRKGRARRA